jgi:sn-glycerol 3-phosphate transport system ATP-binding protein
MNALELRGVVKRFDRVTAVDRVSLDVRTGEFCVLLGPSGCGKSTLLRLIAGLEPVTEGEIIIGGERVTDREPKARDIAMVFQHYALYPHLTVYDNLAFPLRARRRPRHEIDEQVREVAALLQIDALLDRRPRALSGGQRQRVAIGRAIVRRPKLFLFDEPLSNLDAQLRLAMRAELARLHRRLGTTVIYVTHDQTEAMTLGTRIALMNAGRLEQIGTPEELYDRPATVFAAAFIGNPAMNLIDGRIDRGRFTGRGVAAPVDGPDGPVTLGVRPEELAIDPDGPWEGTVDLVEQLGAETLIHIKCGDALLVARVPGRSLFRPQQPVRLTPRVLHLFDPSGRRRDHTSTV